MRELVRPRRGHFDLGTGYHGDVWLDLDALFLRPASLREPAGTLAEALAEHRVDAVCGPMEGGAFLGYAVAEVLGTAFLPGYRTADGYRLAPPAGGISGWRVAIVDDAVNAGTAVRACAGLLREHGAVPVAVAALLAVGPARETLARALPVPFHAVDAIESHAWRPADCPLCASRVPFSDPAGPA